ISMNTIDNIKERYRQQAALNGNNALTALGEKAFDAFNHAGIPTARNEEWKYTRISSVFNKEFIFSAEVNITAAELDAFRLPGYREANELVFVNGFYHPSLSNIQSSSFSIIPLKD